MHDEFFKQLVESLEGYAVFTTDLDGNINSWNSGSERLLEYTEKDVIGKNVSLIFTTEDVKNKADKKEQAAALKHGQGRDERWHVKKNGDRIWCSGLVFPLKDQAGTIQGFTKVMRDLTLSKRTEDRLTFLSEASKILSSSLNYQKTLNAIAHVAVPHIADWCAVDILDDGEIEQVAVAHIDPKKVKWAKELRKREPVNLSDSSSGIVRVINTGKSEFYPLVTDEMLVVASKSKKHLKLLRDLRFKSVIISPLIAAGKTLGAMTFVVAESNRLFTKSDVNMAEEVSNRAALAIQNAQLYKSAQENEHKFKSFFNSNIVGVFTADKNGDILDANDGYLRIIGYTKEDLQNRKLNRWTLTPLEHVESDKKAMDELETEGSTTPWEKEYVKKDGSQVPVIVAATLIDKKFGTNITIVLDITERKRLEQRKDEFIGIASHELKTPLTSIKGYVQILERTLEDLGNDKAIMLVSKTNTYINRMNSLIADLLDVSKIQAGKLQLNNEVFDFYDLIHDGIEAIQPTSTRHKIICDNCIHQKIEGDKHRLEQVLMNLLSNAIKYSPKADKIVIKTQKNKDIITISIRDYGVGIPKKSLDKLFQRFYRVDKTAKDFSGLGIGLYISCEIVSRHGGKMWVESKEGKGSTFFFTLPILPKYE